MTKPFPKIPLRRAEGLHQLNDAEVVAGYRAGLKGETEPNPNASYSFWHGWRNGMVDSGRAQGDAAQAELARDIVATGYLKSSRDKEVLLENYPRCVTWRATATQNPRQTLSKSVSSPST